MKLNPSTLLLALLAGIAPATAAPLGANGLPQASRSKPTEAAPPAPAAKAQPADKTKPEEAPKAIEVPLTPELIKKVKGNPEWNMAMEMLGEDGDFVDLKEAKARGLANSEKVIEITAKIITKVEGRIPEYGFLIYQADPKGTVTVFVSDPQKTPKDNQKQVNKSLFNFCQPWGAWQTGTSYCAYAYTCFFKGQQAKFHQSQRSRQCKNGVQIHHCLVREGCGC